MIVKRPSMNFDGLFYDSNKRKKKPDLTTEFLFLLTNQNFKL
jgi:hypothetical protein